MSQLWFFYDQTYQSIFIDDEDKITLGNELHHTVTVNTIKIEPYVTLVKQSNVNEVSVYQGDHLVGTLTNGNQLTLQCEGQHIHTQYESELFDEQMYYIGNQTEIKLSNHTKSFLLLVRYGNMWQVHPMEADVYINGEKVLDIRTLSVGDTLFYNNCFYVLEETDALIVRSKAPDALPLPLMKKPTSVMKRKYPNYRRTPRMIYDLPEDKVDFSFPSEERDNNQRGLWLIIAPPLMMLIVMGVVAMVRPRGIFILISITMFTTTLITSTFQYFREKKKERERNEKRVRLYTRYLEEKRDELQKLAKKQRDVLYFHFPSFRNMKYLTSQISDRIWERSLDSHDFLHFRIGRASVPASYRMTEQRGDTSNKEIDDLFEHSEQLVKYYEIGRASCRERG